MKCREVFLSADAHVDFKTGREFYDRNSTKAGDYFVASVLSDLESLSFYAGIHPLFNGYYRMLSRRFPFAVYYEIHEEQVWVVAILDMRSKPDGIIEKLKNSLFSNKVSDNVSDYVSAVRLAQQHQVILIGGPNGAGKSTTAPDILQGGISGR